MCCRSATRYRQSRAPGPRARRGERPVAGRRRTTRNGTDGAPLLAGDDGRRPQTTVSCPPRTAPQRRRPRAFRRGVPPLGRCPKPQTDGLDPRRTRGHAAARQGRCGGVWEARLARVATHASTRRGQWLLTIAVVAGLIGMHHFPLTCSSSSAPASVGQSVGTSLSVAATATAISTPAHVALAHQAPNDMAGGGLAHAAALSPASTDTVVVPTTDNPSPPGTAPECCGGMSGHPCMAVLLATPLLMVALMVVLFIAAAQPPPGRTSRPVTTPARAPPTATVRRAELCLWRC